MATNISGAEQFPEADYSIPHRSPPPVPPPGSRSPPLTSSSIPNLKARAQADSFSESASEHHRRRPSLGIGSLLRRTSSGKHLRDSSGNGTGAREARASEEAVPPLPTTRIAQAHQQAAEGRISTSSNRKVSGEGRTMLRKTSKAQREQERQAREAERQAYLNRPAPQLNSLTDIHASTFGTDGDPRPDSVAIFNHSYHTSPAPRAANFSRPGNNITANMAPSSSSPAYAVRGGSAYSGSPAAANKVNGSKEYVVDPTERTESMTNRGRYSYASTMAPVNVSSPRRVRRRKDPTPFNVLVVGAKNSGKSSLISFLRHSLALPVTKQSTTTNQPETSTYSASKSSFTSHYLETEMDGERMGLTLWDSAGLEKNIVDLQLREMATFVESKFEETFVEEQKVMRSPGVKDTHIHCVFLILDPVRLDANIMAAQKDKQRLDRLGGLDDELDLQVLRVLWGKTTVIPIVSKADTLTMGHMSFLKRAVWESVKSAKLDPLEALELEDDLAEEDEDEEEEEESEEDEFSDAKDNSAVIDNLADDSSVDQSLAPTKAKNGKKSSHNRNSSLSAIAANASVEDETPYIPMSILSPDPYDLPPYTKITSKHQPVGRRFPWGFADPYNAEHCDFTRLRDSIFSEWRQELRDLSRSKWYENWRTSRLKNVPGSTRRVRGGVTPVGSVPREGRTSSNEMRVGRAASAGGGREVPRSVSGGVTNGNVVPIEGRVSQAGAGARETMV